MNMRPARTELYELLNGMRDWLRINRRLNLELILDLTKRIEVIRLLVSRGVREDHIEETEYLALRAETDALVKNGSLYELRDEMIRVRRIGIEKREVNIYPIGAILRRLAEIVNSLHMQPQLDLSHQDLQPQLDLSHQDQEYLKNSLRNILPGQKISPVQFYIYNDILSVQHTKAEAKPQDESLVNSARAALIEQGDEILKHLKTSNCDLRFLAAVENLQRKLSEASDIIYLAIFNISCEEMRKQFEDEISSAVSAKLKSHFNAISMYAAQFPDWARFIENSVTTELTESDIQKSKAVAEDLVARLSELAHGVDPEVPNTIKYITKAISDPREASKRTAFALIRTLENLISRVFEYSTEFIGEMAAHCSSNAAKWGGRAMALVLVSTIIQGAGALTPIYSKFSDSAWVKDAVEIMRKLELK